MHFCTVCSNMYYLSIDKDDPNKLIHYCRHCGNEENNISFTNPSVYKTESISSSQEPTHLINKYTKLDPTLPRVNNILCPNNDCDTNLKGKEKEIIYIRYDETNMKYLYLCSTCDTVWQTNDN